jgi:hypothetical protein
MYNIPIWDVLAPEGTQEGAGEHLTMGTRSRTIPIRQVVPVGLLWARFCSWACWAPFFIRKTVYYSRHSVFTYNILFYKCLRTQYWVDGVAWVWMPLSQLGKQLPLLGLGFGTGLVRLGFP